MGANNVANSAVDPADGTGVIAGSGGQDTANLAPWWPQIKPLL